MIAHSALSKDSSLCGDRISSSSSGGDGGGGGGGGGGDGGGGDDDDRDDSTFCRALLTHGLTVARDAVHRVLHGMDATSANYFMVGQTCAASTTLSSSSANQPCSNGNAVS
ncbi:hypothetical protein SprV_0401677900 [Sparganum proliferum]